MPKQLKEFRSIFRKLIGERIASLVSRGEWFDAMIDIGQHLPLEAVSNLVGLPSEARSKMLRWAAATFNSFGIPGGDEASRQRFAADIEVRHDIQRFLRAVEPADLKPGSWGERLFLAVEAGRMEIDEARSALSALVLPSLDTTIYAKGNLLYDLAQSPGEWTKLRADPSLVTAAVMEGMRHRSVVRWFSRVAECDYVTNDVQIPAGARVMLLYGSANRDERHYSEPDRFDIARAPMDHLGWGTGPHMCAGMHLARMEMEVLLEAMIEHVTTIEVGEPSVGTNQGLFGFERLPMRLR